jgi:hypothetical protein
MSREPDMTNDVSDMIAQVRARRQETFERLTAPAPAPAPPPPPSPAPQREPNLDGRAISSTDPSLPPPLPEPQREPAAFSHAELIALLMRK